MPFSRIAYIGQRRNVTSLAGYGLGDAQIDAQNRTTDQIGSVLAAYGTVKNSGGLTVGYIQGAMNQIQGLIEVYKTQYATTSRGKAGAVTLQTFVDNQVFPAMRIDAQNAANAVPGASSISVPDYGGNNTVFQPVPFGGNTPTVININQPGQSGATAGNIQPSETPGPPSGISIPGTSVDVTAEPLQWWENPGILIAIGIGALFLFTSKNRNA